MLLLIAGCAKSKDFSYGIKQINNLNTKYNTSIETYPKSISQIKAMIGDFNELKNLKLDTGQESFNYVIKYRLLNLEAEKLYIESQKYGTAGTTKFGFGCKSRPLIIESAQLRNASALKAFEAVDLLREFVSRHQDDAASAGLSAKNALFLNASFYQISKDARTDSNIINHFCPKNITLELYQQEFIKRTNFSEAYITNLNYEEAAEIWKRLKGIENS